MAFTPAEMAQQQADREASWAAAAKQQQAQAADPNYQAAVASRDANQAQTTNDLYQKLGGQGNMAPGQHLSVAAGANGAQGVVTGTPTNAANLPTLGQPASGYVGNPNPNGVAQGQVGNKVQPVNQLMPYKIPAGQDPISMLTNPTSMQNPAGGNGRLTTPGTPPPMGSLNTGSKGGSKGGMQGNNTMPGTATGDMGLQQPAFSTQPLIMNGGGQPPAPPNPASTAMNLTGSSPNPVAGQQPVTSLPGRGGGAAPAPKGGQAIGMKGGSQATGNDLYGSGQSTFQ